MLLLTVNAGLPNHIGSKIMKRLSCLLILALANCATAQPKADTCPIAKSETDALLTLSFAAFDQNEQGGWRKLERQAGCELRAAYVIEAYLARNKATIPRMETMTLTWHLGQMWANGGQSRKAITAFKATKEPGNDAQNFYADATIAFLARDRAAFNKARANLLLVPKPRGFDEAMAGFNAQYNQEPPPWPLNLDVIDRMGRCFSSSYTIAYGGTCSPAN
jgi:hypothetical protein